MNLPSDSTHFRRTLGHYPTGVCIVTAMEEAGPVAMVVGTFTSVSLDPPLIAFLPARSSRTWVRIREVGRFCVNVLAAHHEELCRAVAAGGAERFAEVPFCLSPLGSPILEDGVAWIDCDLHAVHEAGDHFIVLGRVLDMSSEASRHPLLFYKGGYGCFSSQV